MSGVATDRELGPSLAADRVSRGVFILAVLAIYPRLFFGVEFFDGAFYVALPYSFDLGHRPFLDESALHQLAGLLTWPFVNLHLRIMGSNEGIVLLSRHLFFAASLGTSLLVRRYLRQLFPEAVANLVALIPLAYIPFCIPDLSYNTIAHLGLLAGAVLLASALLTASPGRYVAAATASFGLASFAYPPMILSLGPSLALGLALIHRVNGKAAGKAGLVAAVATSALTISLAAALLIALGLPGELERIIEVSQSQAQQGGGLVKLEHLWREFKLERSYFTLLAITLSCILGLHCALRDERLAILVSLLLGPALYLASGFYVPFTRPMITTPFVLSALGLAAPFLLFVIRHRIVRERWLGLVIIATTSFLAASVILWATANGLRNAALGFLPAALVTIASLSLLRRSSSLGHRSARRGVVFAVLVASLLAFQIHQLWDHFYREETLVKLDQRIDSGAWRGIRTSAAKKHFIDALGRALETHRGDAETVLFFDHFPGGYLLSDLQPLTSALWIFPSKKMFQGTVELRRIYAQKYRAGESLPDMVVRMSCIPAQRLFNVVLPPDDPLAQHFVGDHYQTVETQRCYEILKKVPSSDS